MMNIVCMMVDSFSDRHHMSCEIALRAHPIAALYNFKKVDLPRIVSVTSPTEELF